jgi:microcin C transport system permease protein
MSDERAGFQQRQAYDAQGRPKGWLSPTNRRRWANFKANRRGYWSLWIFMILFIASLLAEFIANDRPILASYKGGSSIRCWLTIRREIRRLSGATDYRDPFIQDEIEANGWILWPPIRYSYTTANSYIPHSAPTAPFWLLDEGKACSAYPLKDEDPGCTLGNMNWLGTDDQARDVTARMIYGFRISVLFGLTLTIFSALIGIAAGAVQGYFGGWTDLLMQRFIEIWSSMPVLYILMIIAAVICRRGSGSCSGSCCCFPGCRLSASSGQNSCAPAISNMSTPPGRWAWATPRSCSATCCPTPWWRR